jgi:hypothetical protein
VQQSKGNGAGMYNGFSNIFGGRWVLHKCALLVLVVAHVCAC